MECFTARQPIFDSQLKARAYELLHRESEENRFPANVSPIQATSKVLVNTFLNTNVDNISDGKAVLVNFPLSALRENFPEVAPHDKIILEILEDVEPTEELYSILRTLFHKRYKIALDDFIYKPEWEPFLKFVKLVKFDIQNTRLSELKDVVRHFRKNHPKIKLLAEKVETHEEFREAKSMGFDFFQGYFFAKPEVIKSCSVDISESSLMGIYAEVMKPEIDFQRLNKLFQCDLPLCYKLLNYVNSPAFGIRVEIESIKQALSFLGENLLRRFTCLLVTSELSQNKPPELLKTSIYRARFCELIVQKTPFSAYADRAFLAGLFSTIDAVLDARMADIMSQLPLDRDIKLALVQNVGLLAGALNIIKSYEQGAWDDVDTLAKSIDLDREQVGGLYIKAINWEKQQIEALTSNKQEKRKRA
jgi:EAL and modified HD-GYP domain-containing signal transduction protein